MSGGKYRFTETYVDFYLPNDPYDQDEKLRICLSAEVEAKNPLS